MIMILVTDNQSVKKKGSTLWSFLNPFKAEARLDNILRTQSAPQRKHNPSPLQRSAG
jgi:hypothetical protein